MDESKPKRKTHTSSAVKRRYNEKTYSPWHCQIKKAEFEEIETLRKSMGLSRPEFLKALVSHYTGKFGAAE